MKYKKFNLNHNFFVKLTDAGFEKLRQSYYVSIMPDNNLPTLNDLKRWYDFKDGYVKIQAHQFLKVFGNNFCIWDHNKYFDLNILIPEEELE